MMARWTIPGLALLWVACAPRAGRIESMPCAGADGQVILGPASLALIGHFADAPSTLETTLAAESPTLVVLTGDSVPRSSVAAWAELHRRLDGLAVSPLPGSAEGVGDRHRKGFVAAWSGLGVSGLPGAVPWRAFDIADGPTRWRLVLVDADRQAVADRWTDQLFWLPKVVGDHGYDHLVVLAASPPGSLGEGGAGPDPDLAQLLELIREHADAERLVLLATGGTRSPSLVLPGGRWGEAWLTTGQPTPPAPSLLKERGSMRLAPQVEEALNLEFERRAGMELEGLRAADRFDAAVAPVAGWWWAEFHDGGLALTLRLSDGGSEWVEAVTMSWTPAAGWTAR